MMDAPEAAAQFAETALWERLRGDGRADDIEAFIRFYPNSRHAAAAQRRLAELRAPAQAGSTPPPPQVAQSAPPPPPAAAGPGPPPPAPPRIAAPAPPPAQQQQQPQPARDQFAALQFVPPPRVVPETRAVFPRRPPPPRSAISRTAPTAPGWCGCRPARC